MERRTVAATRLMEDGMGQLPLTAAAYLVGAALLVPVALEQTGRVIINSEMLPGTAQNDVNTLRGSFSVLPWRYLTDTDGWFLGAARRGIKFFDSGTPTISTSAPDPKTGSVTIRFATYAGGMVTDWRQWSAHRTAQS